MESQPPIEPTEPQEHRKSMGLAGKVISIVVLVLILIVVVLVLNALPEDSSESEVEEIAPGQHLVRVPEGELVANFPEELMLEKGRTISESYSINYTDANVEQPVVTYRSELSLEANIVMYGDYLRATGWQITLEPTNNGQGAQSFYALRNNEEVSVSFRENDETKVDVTVAYVLKKNLGVSGSLDGTAGDSDPEETE